MAHKLLKRLVHSPFDQFIGVGLKYFSILFVLSFCLNTQAQETRAFTFQRFHQPFAWHEGQGFPKVRTDAPKGGTLSTVMTQTINSLHPYDYEDGLLRTRPTFSDDLIYENLMTYDPIEGTERIFPLVARALRFTPDFSEFVFELDPRARFQDGSPVTGADIVFSLDVLKASNPQTKAALEANIAAVEPSLSEVRLKLKTKNQAARNALMLFNRLKVVKAIKPVTADGITRKYMGTGAYEIVSLNRNKAVFHKRANYWAAALPTRQGFFNFDKVEVETYMDPTIARLSLNRAQISFYEEKMSYLVPGLSDSLKKKGVPLDYTPQPMGIAGNEISSYVFNLDRPLMNDVRVRRALVLAYDFDTINNNYFGNALKRPVSLLEDSALAPTGVATGGVKERLEACGQDSSAPFEKLGNAEYSSFANSRERLRAAHQSLKAAGLKVQDGQLMRPLGDDRWIPVTLKILAYDEDEMRQLLFYKENLRLLGITAEVTRPVDGAAFNVMIAQNNYDIATATEQMLTADRWPRSGTLKYMFLSSLADRSEPDISNPNRLRLPCMDEMIASLDREDPNSQAYKDASEAIARLQQGLYLNIFMGQPKARHIFTDPEIEVPDGLSRTRTHMYGYRKPSYAEPMYDNPPSWLGGDCQDLSCIFGGH